MTESTTEQVHEQVLKLFREEFEGIQLTPITRADIPREFREQVAEALGIPLDDVEVEWGEGDELLVRVTPPQLIEVTIVRSAQ